MEKVISIETIDNAVTVYEELKQVKDFLKSFEIYEKRKKELESELKTLLGDEPNGELYLGSEKIGKVSTYPVTTFDSAKFKKENPDMVAKYEKTSIQTRLTI